MVFACMVFFLLDSVDYYMEGEKMLHSIIKYFFLMLCSCYGYTKLLNIKIKQISHIYNFSFSLICAPIIHYIVVHMEYLTILSVELLLAAYCGFLYRKKIALTISISIISIAVSYVFFSISMAIVFPLIYIIFVNISDEQLFYIVSMSIACLLQVTLMILLFKIPRLKKGIPDIEKKLSGDVGIFSGVILLLISSMFFSDDAVLYSVILLLFTVVFGVVMFVWYRKYISNNYVNRSMERTTQILENTINEQKEEIERLSKIIHKDNKLISALELSVQELHAAGADDHSAQLKREFEILSAERKDILRNYEAVNKALPKTGVFSTDVMIKYLYKKALDSGISFDVSITGNIEYMVKNIVDERDLNTLIADIGENALIAVQNETRRNVLLIVGVKGGTYCFDVLDSGTNFEVGVIENLGVKRYTTHGSHGGSGIGLMTTIELCDKYKASFEIEELCDNELFTKRVSVVFDSLFQKRIISERKEIIPIHKKREDITFCER